MATPSSIIKHKKHHFLKSGGALRSADVANIQGRLYHENWIETIAPVYIFSLR